MVGKANNKTCGQSHTEKQHYLLRECCFLQHYVGMSCVDRQELNLTELLQREGKLDIVYLV